MGTMFDSTDPAAIPTGAEIVAGYVDGAPELQSYAGIVERFPDAVHVSITVEGAAGAMVADCEQGNPRLFPPDQTASWCRTELAAGRRPCVYCNRSSLNEVTNALEAETVALSEVDFWVADWLEPPKIHLLPGTVATQWLSPTNGSTGNYDVSSTAADWPPVPVVPPPAPVPAPAKSTVIQGKDDDTMTSLEDDYWVHVWGPHPTTGVPLHWWQPKPGTGTGPEPYKWNVEYLPVP